MWILHPLAFESCYVRLEWKRGNDWKSKLMGRANMVTARNHFGRSYLELVDSNKRGENIDNLLQDCAVKLVRVSSWCALRERKFEDSCCDGRGLWVGHIRLRFFGAFYFGTVPNVGRYLYVDLSLGWNFFVWWLSYKTEERNFRFFQFISCRSLL